MKVMAHLFVASVVVIGLSTTAGDLFGQLRRASETFRTGTKSEKRVPDATNNRDRTPIVLRLSVRDAGAKPSVAGDFTNWVRVRMTRYENEWRLSMNLAPGVYRYAFRNEDGHWFVPPSIPNRLDDGMGGWVAVLIVQ